MAVLALDEKSNTPILAPGGERRCIACGHCVAICPIGAISLASSSVDDCLPVAGQGLPDSKQIFRLLQSRRSVRQFHRDPVPRDALKQLVEATRWVPSAKNIHPVQWVVVDSTEVFDHLRSLMLGWMQGLVEGKDGESAQKMFGPIIAAAKRGRDLLFWNAPSLIVAYALRKIRTAPADASIALASSELLAATMGLGTCWAGYFQWAANEYEPLRNALNLSERHAVLGAVMVGYPAARYHRIPSRPVAEVRWLSDG